MEAVQDPKKFKLEFGDICSEKVVWGALGCPTHQRHRLRHSLNEPKNNETLKVGNTVDYDHMLLFQDVSQAGASHRISFHTHYVLFNDQLLFPNQGFWRWKCLRINTDRNSKGSTQLFLRNRHRIEWAFVDCVLKRCKQIKGFRVRRTQARENQWLVPRRSHGRFLMLP